MSTVATLLVRLAGDTADLDRAFAGVEQAGKGLERSWGGVTSRLKALGDDVGKSLGGAFASVGSTAGPALSAVNQGLGRVSDALNPIVRLLPGLPGGIAAFGQSASALVPLTGALGGVAGGLTAVAGLATGAVLGMVALARGAADAGDELLVLSQQTGLSVEALSKLQYVEQTTDASVASMTKSIGKLGENLAAGSEKTTKAIGAIGLSIDGVRKMRPEEAFGAILKGLGEIPDQGQRAAAGVAIFGKGFHDVSQLAVEDLGELMAEADQFGATISTDLAVAGDRFNDTLAQITNLLGGLKRTIGAAVLPVLQALAESLRDNLMKGLAAAGTSTATFSEQVTGVALRVAQAFTSMVGSIAKGIGQLVGFFSSRLISDAPIMREIERWIRLVGILDSIKPGEQFFSSIRNAITELNTMEEHLSVNRWVANVQAFQSGLDKVADGFAKTADQMGKDLPQRVAEINREIRAQADQLRTQAGAFKTFGAELDTTGRKSKEAADEILTLTEALSGTGAVRDLGQLEAALKRLAEMGLKPTEKGMADVRDVLDAVAAHLKAQGQKIPDAMGRLYASMIPPPQVVNGLGNLERTLMKTFQQVPSIRLMVGEFRNINDVLADIPKVNPFAAGLDRWLATEAVKEKVGKWTAAIATEIRTSFSNMLTGVSTFGEGFESIFGSVRGYAADVMDDVTKTLGTKLNEWIETGSTDFGSLFKTKFSAKGAIAAAAVGFTVGQQFGQAFGTAAGAFAGAVSGALAGAMLGGPYGALAGGAAGLVGGMMGGMTSAKQERRAIAQSRTEIELAFGSVEKLRAAADRFGLSWHALWEDTGDIENYQHMVDLLNRGLAQEKRQLEELGKELDLVASSGALMSQELLKDIVRAPEGGEAGVFAFMQQQAQAATKGIETFLSHTTVKTKQGALAISATLAGLYEEMISQGAKPSEAFAALEPSIAKLGEQMQKAGLQGTAAFGPLAQLAQLSADAIAGPMFDAMAGLEQGLVSTHNLGLLNQETFAGFTAELLAGYKTLETQGKGGVIAMQGMRGALQKAWELAEDFGYTLTEDEQKLLDFAESSGLIGEQFRPATDRMITALDRLVDRMDQFLIKVGNVPEQASGAARATEDSFNRIDIREIKIPFRFEAQNELPASTTLSFPALAAGGVVRRPTIALVGEKGPEAVVPLGSTFNTGPVTTEIYLDGDVIARSTAKRTPRVLRAYGAVR